MLCKGYIILQDTWFHLLLAERVRENRHRPPPYIRGFLLPHRLDYPVGFHILLSFLNFDQRRRIEPYLGGIFDGIYGILIIIFTWVIFELTDLVSFNGFHIAMLAYLFFLITPAMLGMGWGPRALSGTPRILGQILFFTSISMFILFLITLSPLWFVGAAVAGSLIFITSKFSSQVFVFANLLAALIRFSAWPLLLIPISYAIAILFSKGYVWKVTLGQIDHLVTYMRTLRPEVYKDPNIIYQEDPNIIQRNRVQNMIRFPIFIFKDPSRAISILYNENSYIYVFLQIPMVVLCLWILLRHPLLIFKGSVTIGVAGAYVLALLVIFLLTSLRSFLFLGESERYVEHAVPFMAMIIALCYFVYPRNIPNWLLGLTLLVSVGIYAINIFLIIYGHRKIAGKKYAEEVTQWISDHAVGKRIAVIYGCVLFNMIPCLTNSFVLRGMLYSSSKSPEYNYLFRPKSRAFGERRAKVFRDYKIDYVVVYLSERQNPNIIAIMKEYKCVLMNQEYAVLACKDI
jgi:hypothetical protein